MRMNGIRRWFGGFIMISALTVEGFCDSIKTPFVDVNVNDVPLGIETQIRGPHSRGYLILNNASEDVVIHISAAIPSFHELKNQAEPIPDPSWVRFSQQDLRVPKNGQAETEVFVLVPKERRYEKRRFQAIIRAESIPQKSNRLQIRVILQSRLTIGISTQDNLNSDLKIDVK